MQKNSNRCNNIKLCTSYPFQSYELINLGKVVNLKQTISCAVQKNCSINKYKFNKFVEEQQNLYALMRRYPEKFPIISSVKDMNLSLSDQRRYSNLWYRQFGTSQALPVNDNWGGFYIVGSEVPYTN